MKNKTTVSHDEFVIKQLKKDPLLAAEYLKAALEEEPQVLLIALRHLAQAQGMAKVAKLAGIGRESLYRALSAKGNPTFSTIKAVTRAMGLEIQLVHSKPAKSRKSA